MSKMEIFGKEIEYRIAFVGLANAGKTTLVKRLKGSQSLNTVPTMGLNVETLMLGDVEVVAVDLGGQKAYADSLWKPVIQKSDAVLFVFDSADASNVEDASIWFRKTIDWASKETSFLFLANKQDLPEAKELGEIIELLKLEDILTNQPRAFAVYPCSALTGDGVNEAWQWLADRFENLIKKKENYLKLKQYLERSKVDK